jgi:ABC-type nitrate/sulfonate/bicarbonate transport system substrate-binding protein
LGIYRPWLKDPAHLDLARRLYAAYRDAAEYSRKNPDEASITINEATKMDTAAVKYTLANFPDSLSIEPIAPYKGAIKVITQELMVRGKQLEKPFTDAEVDAFVSKYKP